MRYLLDTHTLLWGLTSPDRLSAHAREIMVARSSVLVVSAASAWEIATKQRIGKMPHAEGIVRNYDSHLTRLGVDRLPITDQHALLAGGLDWAHRDPFDRMFAAQAVIETMTLITADPAFDDVEGLKTRW